MLNLLTEMSLILKGWLMSSLCSTTPDDDECQVCAVQLLVMVDGTD